MPKKNSNEDLLTYRMCYEADGLRGVWELTLLKIAYVILGGKKKIEYMRIDYKERKKK